MLRQLAFVLLLGVIGSPLHAQQALKMMLETDCNSIPALRAYLANEHGELAFTSAPGVFKRYDGEYSEGLFRTYVNPQTFTFTATVEFIDDDIACVIGMGEQFAPVIRDGTDT